MLMDEYGQVGLIEEAPMISIAVEGYTKSPQTVDDDEWTRLKRQMATHDISIDRGDNTVKSIKRKESKQ
jgi:hypothetical protein